MYVFKTCKKVWNKMIWFDLIFREHSECPVTACGCHCMKLDSVAMATPAEGINSVTSTASNSKDKQNITWK